MDASEALKGLVSIVGSGGIVGALVAYYAYKREAEAGRKGDPENRLPGLVTGGFATEKTLEPLIIAVTSVASSLTRMNALTEQREERIRKAQERHRERAHELELRERDDGMRDLRIEVQELRRQLRERPAS